MPPHPSPYNPEVIQSARLVADAAIHNLLSRSGSNRGVVVSAPAGAGKTGFVVDAVRAARQRGMRVAVGTPTNEQAFSLVRRLAERDRRQTVTFVPASTVSLPTTAQLPNVQQSKASDANGAEVILGTLSKLGDAFSRGDLTGVDALFVDESYQADSSKYYAVGGLAGLHLLVGDCGQLSPFSTIDDPDHWRGLPEDPLQTAVGVLLRNHPATPVHKLPITRRLDSRAATVAQAFYPDLQFSAAVLPGVRELRISPAISVDCRGRLIDGALDRAAANGWAHIELPTAPALTADPEIVDLITSLVDLPQHNGGLGFAGMNCKLHGAIYPASASPWEFPITIRRIFCVRVSMLLVIQTSWWKPPTSYRGWNLNSSLLGILWLDCPMRTSSISMLAASASCLQGTAKLVF